tara:strand:+ start:5171 stop:6286 length:1116 start_codon:yes stop_codon:yes gene_type:complete
VSKLLIVGLPFFPHKYQYLVDSYLDIGIDVRVLLNSDFDSEYKENSEKFITYAGKSKLKRMVNYISIVSRFKPKNIDCYDYSILSIFYIFVAKLLGIRTRYWLIGWELVGDYQNTNQSILFNNAIVFFKKHLSRLCLYLSDVVYAKEHHHIKSIESINRKLLRKTILIYNCVPVEKHNPRFLERLSNKRDFLYANAVIAKRNVIDLLKDFEQLKEKGINFTSSIYGFNSIENNAYSKRGEHYSRKALEYYYKAHLEDMVDVHGFVRNIKEVMVKYKFFLLPADIVLANYALLEAMSIGLVPIVYPGDGYEEIVQDGVNGIVAKNRDMLTALERALKLSDDEYTMFSNNAHKTIRNKFSIELWKEKLAKNIK